MVLSGLFFYERKAWDWGTDELVYYDIFDPKEFPFTQKDFEIKKQFEDWHLEKKGLYHEWILLRMEIVDLTPQNFDKYIKETYYPLRAGQRPHRSKFFDHTWDITVSDFMKYHITEQLDKAYRLLSSNSIHSTPVNLANDNLEVLVVDNTDHRFVKTRKRDDDYHKLFIEFDSDANCYHINSARNPISESYITDITLVPVTINLTLNELVKFFNNP